MMKKILFLLLFVAAFMACSDDDNTPQPEPGKKAKMIVVNEGLMGKGLGSISVIYDDGSSVYDIFRDVNNNRPLGDVAQSISYINGNYFVPLNNSNKIEVIDPETFKSVTTIKADPGSPRYIQAINETEAVASDLNNQLIKFNTQTFEIIEAIAIPTSIEHMATINNKLFGQAKGKIVVFDINNIKATGMRTIEGIDNVANTTNLIVDKNGMLWAYGSETDKVTLHCINPTTEELLNSYEIPFTPSDAEDFGEGSIIGAPFSWGTDLNRMDTDRTKEKLYFCLKTCKAIAWDGVKEQMVVYSFDINTHEYTPYRTLLRLNEMYGMGISPDGDVFLCDCLDYTAQRGYLREFKADGTVVSTYVGVYPTMIYFTEYNTPVTSTQK